MIATVDHLTKRVAVRCDRCEELFWFTQYNVAVGLGPNWQVTGDSHVCPTCAAATAAEADIPAVITGV